VGSIISFKIQGKIFYGWFILIALIVILSISLGIRASFGVFFKSIEAEFLLSRGATSGIFSAHMLLCSIFAILGGIALDRYGPRKVFLFTGICTGLSLILSSQVHHTWLLFITYSLILAIGTGATFAMVIATASRWFTKGRGLALGIATLGDGFGVLIIAPLAASLISTFNWREALFLIGLAAILLISSFSFLLKNAPPEASLLSIAEKSQKNKETIENINMRIKSADYSLAEALRTKNFWFIAFIYFLFSLSYHLIITHVVPHATDIGITAFEAATIMSLIGIGNIVGRLLVGFISDRIDRKFLCIFCLLIQAIAMFWLTWSHGLWMFYIFAVVFGFAYGGISTLTAGLIGDAFGLTNIGSISGTLVIGFSVGAATGPLIGGFVFDIFNDYFFSFLIGALSALVAIPFVAFMENNLRIRTWKKS
jgi:MFS family permease